MYFWFWFCFVYKNRRLVSIGNYHVINPGVFLVLKSTKQYGIYTCTHLCDSKTHLTKLLYVLFDFFFFTLSLSHHFTSSFGWCYSFLFHYQQKNVLPFPFLDVIFYIYIYYPIALRSDWIFSVLPRKKENTCVLQ